MPASRLVAVLQVICSLTALVNSTRAADPFREITVLTAPSFETVVSVALSTDGSHLVACGVSKDKGPTHTVVWEVASQKQLGSGLQVAAKLWLPEEKQVLVAEVKTGELIHTRHPTHSIQLWDAGSGRSILAIPSIVVTATALSSDGRFFAVASNEHFVDRAALAASTPKAKGLKDLKAIKEALEDRKKNQAGGLKNTFHVGNLHVIDLKARKVVWQMTGETGVPTDASADQGYDSTKLTGTVLGVDFSADNKQLAAFSRNAKQIKLYDLAAGKPAPTLKTTLSLDEMGLAPRVDAPEPIKSNLTRLITYKYSQLLWLDEGFLLRGVPNTVGHLRDAATGAAKNRSTLGAGQLDLVTAYIASDNITLVLVDVAVGKTRAIWKLPGEQFDPKQNELIIGETYMSPVYDVSRDGKRLAVADTRGSIHVYDITAP